MKHTVPHRIPNVCPLFCAILFAAILIPVSHAAPDAIARLSPDTLAGGGQLGKAKGPLIGEDHTISLQRLRLAPPPDAKRQVAAAWEAFQDDEPARAIRKLRKAIAIFPGYVEAHNNLGYIYWGQDRLDEAIGEFETAVELDPSWSTGLVNLALAYFAQGRLREALGVVQRAVKSDPASTRAHYAAGLILAESSSDNAKALEHLRGASGDFPKAQLIEAYVMLRLNRPDQARRTLQTYLMRTPAR